MSNTVLKENVRKKWQKGVALLFALGILGLLLVMALGFATNSIFDQMIATNTGNSSAAKTIAQSGLERVRNMLQNYADSMSNLTGGANFKTLGILGYSYSSDTTDFTTSNPGWLTARSDMLADNRFFGTYTTWTADMTNYINWIYLKADGKLTGRMSYIILNRADLDPAKLVKNNIDESYKTPLTEPEEVRLGVEANEINLRTIDSSIGQADAQKFNYTSKAGVFPGNSWLDLSFLFDQFGLTDSTDPVTPAPNLRNRFTRWFICNSQNSPEAFCIDINGDSKITSAEQFHRFNLARTDWGSAFNTKEKVYENILLDKATVDGVPDQPPKGYINSVTEDGYGIPWLALFGYKTDGTVDTTLGATFGNSAAGVIARRRQIAANLVEYCSSPITAATTHSAFSDQPDWFTTPPTFTGNMKTPYINEIGGHVKVFSEIIDNPPSKYDISVTLTFKLYSEIINIYADAWPRLPSSTPASTLRLKVSGSFIYDHEVGKNAAVSNVNIPISLDVAVFNWSGGAGVGYGTSINTVSTVNLTSLNVPAGQDKVTISNVRFIINSAVLYEQGTPNIYYDYAGINKTSTLPDSTLTGQLQYYNPGGIGTDTQNGWFSFETEDPRQNLNTGDWTAKTATVNNGGIPFYVWSAIDNAGTVVGAVNTNSNPSGKADAETVTDPAYVSAAAHLSTAYIRQGAMVSPWELGFIHRGEKWQTLNLHQYDATKTAPASAITVNGNKYWPGGGAYASGDANILDQIKMNSSTQNYKIDLNNKYQDPDLSRDIVLYALFKNIKTGCAMYDSAPGMIDGTAITDTDIGNIVNNIVDRKGTAVNAYQTRAHVVNDITNNSPGVSPIPGYATKAKMDEILGKMINLVELDSYFTVILVAQTIKDVGGSGATIPINKKRPGDTSPTLVNAELGKFDLVVSGTKYYYADEITSTVKIEALVHKKIDGTCEILSVKYIQ